MGKDRSFQDADSASVSICLSVVNSHLRGTKQPLAKRPGVMLKTPFAFD